MQNAFMLPALLLFCCVPVHAAGIDSAGDAPILSPELTQRIAYHLEHASSLADAASELLLQEQLGELDHDSATTVQRWFAWYQQQNPYDRANYLAHVQGNDWSVGKHNSFWLAQARTLYQHGRLQNAERALRRLREPLDPVIDEQRQSLLGRMLIEQGRFKDALVELENRQGFPRSNLYDHYNFGVALVGQDRKAEGMAVLDELGQTSLGTGQENHALLDRANLAVGWFWLTTQQGGTARAFFKRVSLDSPHSGMALLGLGWAELAPDGKTQEARFKRDLFCEDVSDPPVSVSMLLFSPHLFCRPGKKAATFRYRHRFAYAPGARGPARFRRALRPWLVLNQRQSHDPAVQEAALAIGYAYDQLGEYRQAESAYRQAVQRYEQELRRLDALETALRASVDDAWTIVEQQARPDEFRTVRGSGRFGRILADLDSIQKGAQELQDIRVRRERFTPSGHAQHTGLESLWARWQKQDESLATTRAALNDKLKKLCLEDLAERRARLRQYLPRAVLGLGLLYDRHGDSLKPAPR
ncbi:MAG: hypothetical protein ACRES4_01280 [Nevskiales bacterium]